MFPVILTLVVLAVGGYAVAAFSADNPIKRAKDSKGFAAASFTAQAKDYDPSK